MQFTIAQAARVLDVPYNTVRYRIQHNLIKATRTPFGFLVSRKEIERYRQQRRKRGLKARK